MESINLVTARFAMILAVGLGLFWSGAAVGADPAAGAVSTTQPAVQAEKLPASTQPVPTSQPFQEKGFATTESGLRYKDVSKGQGTTAQANDVVEVHYKGMLEDGKQFDSSYDRDTTFKFRLGQKPPRVIPGWEKGLANMKVGGKRQLIIPPHLAYGLRGMPPMIPPNSTLYFELELVKVIQAPKASETKPEDEIADGPELSYVDIKVGDGLSPTEKSVLKIRASTWKPDGTLLFFTAERQDPATVLVSQIGHESVKKGLMGMKAGGKRKLLIAKPAPPTTQPATTQPAKPRDVQMIIEVELLEVSSPPTIPETPEGEYVINTSGLKYHDIKVGEGESPTETSRVKIHFTGWLEDGTVIDSTILHDMPQDIPLAAPGVIKGWLEGIITMKVGGKRKLVIPPDMAYGKRGRPGVPPESTVIYEIELLEIIKP